MSFETPIRTLVIDEDADERRRLGTLLKSRGHVVEAYPEGDSALRAYEEGNQELVLLDMDLPGITGLQLCRRLRTLPGSASTVVLFMTGTGGSDHLEEALEAGADDYLEKPIDQRVANVRLAIAERRVRMVREREALVRRALHDPVTGLASRKLLEQRLREAIKRVSREADYLFAVMELNLDRFTEINNRYGRGLADEVLKHVARRLEECVRGTDLVARAQSDEFLVFLDGLHDLSDPARVARRITEAFDPPFLLGGKEIRLSCSMGMALSLSGYQTPEEIFRDAGEALSEAKAKGPGSSQMFDPVMQARTQARVQMEERIKRALDDGLMELWYQPLVSLRTQRVYGFEALTRMRDPHRGLVLPGEFIPVAEDSGLIEPLGWWALEKASQQLQDWQQRFPMDPPLSMAVNVSGRQFADPGVFEGIRSRVQGLHLPPESLHLEVTETALMTNVESAVETLNRLKQIDVRLHIDDFGTGYSSMAYLCQFPIDALKIDRSFIVRMSHSPGDLEVVQTIVRLADTLGLEIIAEGVEEEEQHRQVQALGCHAVQGFHFHPPLQVQEVEELLKSQGETA